MFGVLRASLIAALVGLVLGSFSTWKVTADYKDKVWKGIVAEQEVKASKLFAEASAKTAEVNKKNEDLSSALEVKSIETKKQIDSVLADNRRLARKLGGLRDPFAKPTSGCPVSGDTPTPGALTDGATQGRLSDETTEFLLEFAHSADEAAIYANTCHQWAKEISGK